LSPLIVESRLEVAGLSTTVVAPEGCARVRPHFCRCAASAIMLSSIYDLTEKLRQNTKKRQNMIDPRMELC
jgi:hypothetical protein